MKKRLLSIVLALCMVLALMPQMAFADTVTGITYLDASGTQQTCDNATAVTEDDTTWGNDNETTWYVAQGDVTISSSVTVNGEIHLILADGCNLTVNGDITEGSLTIYGQANGTGKLNVSGSIISGYGADGSEDEDFANPGESGGSIAINGGTINAVRIASGNGGRGGYLENGGNGGSITIRGGKVKADRIAGGNGGDGGFVEFDCVTNGGNGGNTTISGGIVEADSITGGNGGKGKTANDAIGLGKHGKNGAKGIIDINGGIVFQGNSGEVYGTSVTLSGNFTIPDGTILTIDSGKTLIIPDGVTLTSNGTIINSGKVYVDGTFTGTADNLYYPLTLVNATASGDTSEHNSKNYAKAGTTITLTSDTPLTGYVFDSWEVSPAGVTIENNAFTMPSVALTVTAQWTECTHPGDKEIRGKKDATCTEKGYSGDEYCLVCNKLIAEGHDTDMVSHKLNHIPNTDATVAETGNNEYWQCKDCKKYFSDAAGTNEIKLDDTVISKLPPEIIKGMNQSVTEGEKKVLSFTSNAAYSDFIRVELDGSELSEENYEKAEGSIIITLDADYVATLPAGEHTIGIVSESGTAETTFTVEEKAAPGTSDDSDRDSKADADKNAKTGDDANLALWLALMLLSGAGITGTTIYTRRKRTNE